MKDRQIVAGLAAKIFELVVVGKFALVMPLVEHQKNFEQTLQANRVVEKRRIKLARFGI